MKQMVLKFKLVKVGHFAASVAICGLTGMIFSSSVSATTINLGSAVSNVMPTDGSTYSSGYWVDSTDRAYQTSSSSNTIYSVNTSRAGDIFYTNNVTYACNGAAYLAAPTCGFDTNIYTPNTNLTADAQRAGLFQSNLFGQIIDGNSANNYRFGTGADVSATDRGSKAYTYIDAQNLYYGTGHLWTYYVDGWQAATNSSGNAINVAGNVQLDGSNIISGNAYANTFYVNGTGVVFAGNVGGVDANNDGVTTVATEIRFAQGGSAMISGGYNLLGNVNFQGNDATFTLAGGTVVSGVVQGNIVTGDIVGTGTNNGTLNFDGSGQVTGTVGLIKNINVLGNSSLVQLNSISGNTTVNTLSINADKAVVQVGGLLTANNVSLGGNTSKLTLNDRGSVPVTTVAINPSNGGATTGFASPGNFQAAGMVGSLDFGTYNATTNVPATGTQGKGTLQIGDNVSVTFSTNPLNGINVTNANNATLVFAGSSAVGGNLGTSATSLNTFNRIWAGATGETVTFQNDVYVTATASSVAGLLSTADSKTGSLITGSGTVNLNGNLNGNLLIGSASAPISVQGDSYSGYGDAGIAGAWTTGGTVNIAGNKTVSGTITTAANGTGSLNFMGNSSYTGAIGAVGQQLANVTFNSASTGAVTTIANDVYATNTTIGNGSNSTVATLTKSGTTLASPMYLGGVVTLANSNTILSLDSNFGTANGAPSTLAFAKNTLTGQLSNANSVRAVANSELVTNGGTLDFSVDAGSSVSANGAFIASTSSHIQVNSPTTIITNNAEKYNIAYLGSVANGQTYLLVSGPTNPDVQTITEGARLVDNSYVLDSTIREGANNTGVELLVTRANNQYITKSGTVGDISNPAALRLGTLAANGLGYTSDMQVVFNKLDIDQWGYGNNQTNLANQVRRLAPIVNGSATQSAFAATTSALSAVSDRLAVLRGDSKMAGTDGNGRQLGATETSWVKVIGGTRVANQNGQYDGYKTTSAGLTAGVDTKIGDGVLGLMANYTNSSIHQDDFRTDRSTMQSYGAGIYGTQEYGAAYVEGNLAYNEHDLSQNRSTVIDRTAHADIKFKQVSGRLAAGYRFALDDKAQSDNILTPLASVEWGNLKQNAYSETQAGAVGLNVDGVTTNRVRTSLGLRYSTTIVAETTYYPELNVAWNNNTGLNKTDVVSSYIGDTTNTKFTTTGVSLPKTSYTVGAGLRFATSKTSEVQLGYGYEGGKGLNAHTAQVKAAWAF